MRDLYSDDDESGNGGVAGFIPERLRKLAGAVVFLGLILLMALWAFRLGTRDAREVPIIRAMEGPARVAPDDPGGAQAPHQGLEVNAVLAEDASPPRVATADPVPEELADEDLPTRDLPEPEPIVEVPMTVIPPRVVVTEAPFSPAETLVPDEGAAPLDAEAVALEPRLIEDPAALTEDSLASEDAGSAEDGDVALVLDEDAAADAEEVALAATDVPPGPRPLQRPAVLARPHTDEVAATLAVSSPAEPPAAIPVAATVREATAREATAPGPGARLVQLGAFDSEAITREAWAQLLRRHGDLLASKSLFVERTTANARVFYRLRVAGFDNTDQTREMCEALRLRSVDCIPVTLQ